MNENRHEKTAQEISAIFEKKFGRFSPDDFHKVSEILETKIRKDRSDFADFYGKLSDDERSNLDFMMGL
jgi:hypothetical protein